MTSTAQQVRFIRIFRRASTVILLTESVLLIWDLAAGAGLPTLVPAFFILVFTLIQARQTRAIRRLEASERRPDYEKTAITRLRRELDIKQKNQEGPS